tara:strand:+ start:35041 stop:35925 length:885 start_codon:yes stop_codon:yes gene_type:complete
MSECSCKIREVDIDAVNRASSTDTSISDYESALVDLAKKAKKASKSKEGRKLEDDYWKPVFLMIKNAKLGISMAQLGLSPEDTDGPGPTTSDMKIQPMGDTRDGDKQFDVAKDEEEKLEDEKEKEEEEKESSKTPNKSEKKDEGIQERAVSSSQQRLFGMVHAYQTGKLDKNRISKSLLSKIEKISAGISTKDSEKIASTKHDDLPEKVTETVNLSDEVRHLGIILESDGYKIASATYYGGGCVLEVKSDDTTHVLSMDSDIFLEDSDGSTKLGSTNDFGHVVYNFKKATKIAI